MHIDVVIGIDTLGKEELLIDIANTLQTLIAVPLERYKIIENIYKDNVNNNICNIFTTNYDDTYISIIEKHALNDEVCYFFTFGCFCMYIHIRNIMYTCM